MSRARPSTRPPKSYVRAVTEPEFVALRERHRAYVRGYFSVREPDAIDELEQELWLQLWRRHDQFRAESSERTWVIGFAENVVKQHRRYRHADELPFTVRPSPR